jgi:3-hydroxyacyl-CoA dehydrogenase
MIDEHSTDGSAVVIGAGTMGGGIAAQLANAGWHVRLLDVPGEPDRDAVATAGLERVRAARPPLLFLPELGERIVPSNTVDDMDCLRDADWAVEAVAERMDVKQAVMAQIAAHAGPRTVVTSNTSGLSLRAMVEQCGAEFRSRFLGSHFLNPPRYLKLLEVVPLPETDPAVAAGFVRFAEQILGHRVVIARDTPGFISTRIWIQHLVATMRITLEQGLSVEEADYLTGALLGRPRSATFRMADLVGLDIVAAIAANQYAALPDDPFREGLKLPETVRQMVADGRIGDKRGGGFYRREGKAVQAVDLTTGKYRPREDVRSDAVESLLRRPLAERLPALATALTPAWGAFVAAVLDSLDAYVEYAGPLIASDVLSVDNVMRWGFQWELGPYEIADIRTGQSRWYTGSGPDRRMRSFAGHDWQPIRRSPEYVTLAECKAAGQTVFETAGAALIDIGDNVACLELRTKMNTFNPALCDAVDRARERAERDFAGLIIGGDGPHFSAGYDLKLLLEAAESGSWTAIDAMLRAVQQTFLGLKYCPVPVVAAVRGYTLGAGCECALHCAAVQAGPELAMGLPEMSAGLVPGGGGIKETLERAMAEPPGGADALQAAEGAFRRIVLAGVSGSAAEARKTGYLRPEDHVSRNADRLLYDAKQRALELSAPGWSPPVRRDIHVLGAPALERLRAIADEQFLADVFSEHDRLIADRVALIIAGGDNPAARGVPEEHLLTLEREALIALAHEPKSITRMRALLETGKPLRN